MENTNLDGWEEIKVESNIWTPVKEGDSIEGVIISKNQGQFGIQTKIALKDGKQLIFPNHIVLQNKIVDCKVGELIKVIFEKSEQGKEGNKPTKIYTVLRKKN